MQPRTQCFPKAKTLYTAAFLHSLVELVRASVALCTPFDLGLDPLTFSTPLVKFPQCVNGLPELALDIWAGR
jgi:hypothetical protein